MKKKKCKKGALWAIRVNLYGQIELIFLGSNEFEQLIMLT